MPAPLTEQAPAKINLTLRVLGRRADGYHELESLVAFSDVADTVTLEPSETATLDTFGPYAAASGETEDNLVLKAFDALQQRVDGLKGGRFTLEKKLPVAAGIGGGSADAAAALRLLARLNGIALDDARLAAAALATGADVPVCVASQARVMRGVGEKLSPPLTLPALPAVLVNPGVPLSTREVFARFELPLGTKPTSDDVPSAPDALLDYLRRNANDLAQPAVACVPLIAEVLHVLRNRAGVRLARMSGSGPTCFALFGSAEQAAAAARSVKAVHQDWWIATTVLGSQRT